ncbi:6-chlorohydroxyquinol-1,2-dioxygenase [Pigmentiphaga litoralis]|uniref:dioxygenase n=1 Tax=Pigmentiphaga litoralis TaxID=516702 RepID=UPI00167844F6|nr:dioxygenase [Pigmentiphaga litoralis]GGX12787.1 6-chlorohydroxyquinol-1,2-dioxygenase [Pigmentiphaga litoralis]
MFTPSSLSITDQVLAVLACDSPRHQQVMESLVRHLHAFVRDVELTEAEWLTAITFLTRTGQICTDKRQEFILLSDTLGVSMLVDDINHDKPAGALESSVLGPYYWEGAPEVPLGAAIAEGVAGEPTHYSGRVTTLDGAPLAGATIKVWSGDGEGNYDMQLLTEMRARAVLRTDADGRYHFWSIKPSYYPVPTDGPVGAMLRDQNRHPNRPGHIHFIVSADGYQPVVTQIFPSDGPYLDSDVVFGVKSSLIADFVPHPVGARAPDGRVLDTPFHTVSYDLVLVPSDALAVAA